jgi:hypothetical protein
MIHQFIFAAPKPGLSAAAFQSYWINFHAVDYAAKIPQIRQYLVAPRLELAVPKVAPGFEGVAEIWLKDDADQIASMQTPQFLQGARADEPRWAAFWQTFVLDTDPKLLFDNAGPGPATDFSKLYVLLKRRPDLSLDAFRQQLIEDASHAPRPDQLARHLIGLARDGQYGFGEPRFDAIEVLSFRDDRSLENFVGNPSLLGSLTARRYVDDRYVFQFVGREHWIIRPDQPEERHA